jgi:predicted RNA-binding protein with PIN domain
MALVRILVDGYSLLHNWPQLAPGKPRHSEAARDELVHILTRYHDAQGTPITIFFDGVGKKQKPPKDSDGRVEVLFSHDGKTADDMIERAAHRFKPYGEVLAVTDDNAERDTVIGMGGQAASCENFIRMVESTMAEFSDDLKNYNRKEQNRFKQNR